MGWFPSGTILSGNTSGSSVVRGEPLHINGGSNITVQASRNTLYIHGAAAGTAAGSGPALSAGTQSGNTGTIVFANSNGITFGMSGSSQVTASVATSYAASDHSHGNPTLALTNLTGTTASASNGFTLSLSAAAPGAGGGIAAGAGSQTATSGTVVFANSNFMTFGMSGSSQITGSYLPGNVSVGVGAGTAGGSTAGTTGMVTGSGLLYGLAPGSNITLSQQIDPTGNSGALTIYGAPTGLTTAAASDHSHGNPTLALTNLSGSTASASNGLTLSLSAAAPPAGVAIAAGTQTGTSGTVAFANSNFMTFGMSGSSQITGSYLPGIVSLGVGAATGGTAGTTGLVTGTGLMYGLAPGSNITLSQQMDPSSNSGGLTIHAGGEATLSMHEPTPWGTGSAFSSHPPSTTYWMPLNLQAPLAVKAVFAPATVSVGIPAGTSSGVAQTFRVGYTRAVSIYKRKDYANSSGSLTLVTYGSHVATYLLTHTSTSQGMTLSWNTDSTGGTSATNTSSAASNWASWFSGPRLLRIPFPATTLTAGEYWLAQAHSTSAASTGATASTAALFSVLHQVPQLPPAMGRLGGSTQTFASYNARHPLYIGVANAHTSNADMNASAISHGTINNWYVVLANT